MRTRYIILSVLVIVLGFIAFILPEKDNSQKELQPELLHKAMIQQTRFITTDEVAHLIISEDPSFRLIDIRPEKDFNIFHLKRAINIDVKDILSAKMKKNLKESFKKNILYGYGTVKADQCWVILKRMGYKNVFVLKGGLNAWWETILNPTIPDGLETGQAVLEQYNFRLAAKEYFSSKGDSIVVEKARMELQSNEGETTGGTSDTETPEEGC